MDNWFCDTCDVRILIITIYKSIFVEKGTKTNVGRNKTFRVFFCSTFVSVFTQKNNKMKQLLDKMAEGGPVFTYIILIAFLAIIVLLVRGLIIKGDNYKTIALIKSVSWFAVAWGFLGRTFGLIMIFDKVQAAGDVAPSIFAEGLKIALIGPLFGILVFALARLGILVLIGLQKNYQPQEND